MPDNLLSLPQKSLPDDWTPDQSLSTYQTHCCMCRRKTNQYVGTVEGPELSSASHLSAESFDSLSVGTASVASHLSEAATGTSAAQVRMFAKINLLVRSVQPYTLWPLDLCSTSLTKVPSHPASRLT